METVGDSITETREATEVCKQAQVEEHVIHVVGSTNFNTRLQFFLLGSTWFPRPLGVCLWSAMQVLLVFYEALMLLVVFPPVFSVIFVVAVYIDAVVVVSFIIMVLLYPFVFIISYTIFIVCWGVGFVLYCLWLVVSCKCCTMPPRALGQSLVQFICIGGGTVPDEPQDPQPAAVVEGGAAAVVDDSLWADLKEFYRESFTRGFVNHVSTVSFPYRRARLRDLCREIVPWHDNIVI